MKSAQQLLTKWEKSTLDDFKAFIAEFDGWVKANLKAHKDDYLIGQIYKENVFFRTEDEYTQVCKCQAELAHRCLKSICEDIEKKPDIYPSRTKHIVDFIFDLAPFVDQIMKKKDPNFQFIAGGKSYSQNSIWMFREASNLFWSSTVTDKNLLSHMSAVSLSVFALRQAVEVRFRRAIGIERIVDDNANDAKLRHDFMLEFFAENPDLVALKVGSMTNLTLIYKWTNYSIHTGSMPNMWEIQFALDYCSKLFEPDKPDPKKGWSIDSSIKIKNYDELKKRWENKVNANATPVGQWHFIYMKKPDAVVA
ncbi:MAG: hypothetical protein WBN75_15425 [Verrucomicrobiia bacterium]